jgi:hypothetical protein
MTYLRIELHRFSQHRDAIGHDIEVEDIVIGSDSQRGGVRYLPSRQGGDICGGETETISYKSCRVVIMEEFHRDRVLVAEEEEVFVAGRCGVNL